MSQTISALIRHLAGPGSGREVAIDRSGPLTIGRDSSCGLRLEGPTISRLHARILLDDEGPHVELQSAGNPLWVNGSRVERSRLRLWDLVVLGPHVLRVERIGVQGATQASGRTDADASLLACLLEVQRLLASDEDRVIQRSLEVLLPALPASRLALFDLGSDGTLSQGPTAVRGGGDPLMSATFAKRVLDAAGGLMMDDGSPDAPDWTATMREQSVRSILGVPVRAGSSIRGVLLCDNREQPGQLDASHLRILDALARSLEHVVQRDELRRLALERMRTDAEVAAAQQIQSFLMSGTTGTGQCGAWSVIYRPALDLAGDVLAVHGDADATTWLVADVSGKGLPAALVAAMIKASSSRRLREGCTPRDLLCGLHQDLADAMPPTMFFTACAVQLRRDGSFLACGVGHPPVLVIRNDGTVELLRSAPGMLGLRMLDPGLAALTDISGRVAAGDRLALITDGATEAASPDGSMPGDEGVARMLSQRAGRPPAELAECLVASLLAHCAGQPLGDDLTAVIGGF